MSCPPSNLLNRENRTCSFLFRTGEMLSSEQPLALNSPVFGKQCCWLLTAPPLLLLSPFRAVTWGAWGCQSSLHWSVKANSLFQWVLSLLEQRSSVPCQFTGVSHLNAACMNHGSLSSKFAKQWLSPRADTTVCHCGEALVWQPPRQAIPRAHRI